jgi:hypothetical protein
MPRPRKPKALLEASGAFAKNPSRALDRIDEPQPTSPLGSPPAAFLNAQSPTSVALLGIWRELEAQAVDGVLTGCDRMVFENACRLQYVIRSSFKPGSGHLAQMKAYLAEMGMTPAGRTRVAARKAKEADQRDTDSWAAFAEERAKTNSSVQ